MFETSARLEAVKQWLKLRVENIHKRVSAADVLTRNGVSLRKHGGQEEQISCPFHGTDTHPSARYYPESGESLSHVWCFACRKNWDAIGLWKQFTGEEKFSKILFQIEHAFGLTAPEFTFEGEPEDEYDPLLNEVQRLFETCENNLREYRSSFDMLGHLRLGSLLDQIRSSQERGALSLPETKIRLNQILAKIGQKVRAAKANPTNG